MVFKLQTKVGQHKRFGSLIALTSCDGSYEPKHSHSPARAFCILDTQSMVFKLQTQEGQYKEILVLIASTSSDSSCEHDHSFSHTQSMVFKLQTQVGQHKRFWYLSHQRAAMAHASLVIHAIQPEPSLHACTKYGSEEVSDKAFDL